MRREKSAKKKNKSPLPRSAYREQRIKSSNDEGIKKLRRDNQAAARGLRFLSKNTQLQRWSWFKVSRLRALTGLLDYQERLPSPLGVFIMAQCCKITGFPQCFLLFVRFCHGNLERVHVGDSGLSCKAPRSGIYDVSGSCAKAFLWLLSDSSSTGTSLSGRRNYCRTQQPNEEG